MIDAENLIFSRVATALRATFPGIFVTGEYVAAPQSFPAVSIVEADTANYERTRGLPGRENHASVMYEVNAYSNLSSGKKSQCKAVLAVIDTEMQGLGLLRVGSNPVEAPNASTNIYRMVARYRGVISSDLRIYRK